jgi:hypothetical protein
MTDIEVQKSTEIAPRVLRPEQRECTCTYACMYVCMHVAGTGLAELFEESNCPMSIMYVLVEKTSRRALPRYVESARPSWR